MKNINPSHKACSRNHRLVVAGLQFGREEKVRPD